NGDRLWYKQIAEDTKPLEIFGGLTTEGAARGQEDRNFKGSAIASEFVLLDEVDKGQPAIMTPLLSLMNTGERKYSVQGRSVVAASRSFHLTSNLTIGQLVERFIANSQDGSGLALINRI